MLMVDSRKWSQVWVEKSKRLGQCPTSFSKTTVQFARAAAFGA
jgi:hypothetical protein